MSYVYCGHCGTRGHNRLGCPDRKSEAAANPDGYIARQLAREKETRRRAVESRTCSYCDKPGHNRRGCQTLKGDKLLIKARQEDYVQKFNQSCRHVGLAPGSLLRVAYGGRENPWSKEVLTLVTEINWNSIDFLNEDADLNRDWSLANRSIVSTRVVSTRGFSEEDSRWDSEPTQGSRLEIGVKKFANLHMKVFGAMTADPAHSLELVGPASATVSFVPSTVLETKAIKDKFNLEPGPRASKWEKSRLPIGDGAWAHVRKEDHEKFLRERGSS